MAEKKKKASNSSMRLDKFLVEMGKGSRSQIKEMAKKGRIQVNGTVIKATDGKIDPEKDVVLLDGQPVSYAHTEYFMLNKPAGTVSATEDGKYPTVISLIDAALRKDLFPVGRLDLDTEGLLLITNDGAMAHELLSPKKHVDKIYLAYIEGTLPKDAKKRTPGRSTSIRFIPSGTARCEDIKEDVKAEKRSEERRVGKECRSRWSPYH